MMCHDESVCSDRLLIAVLVKHHGLGHIVLNLLSSNREVSAAVASAAVPLPRCLVDVCKIVHQARTALIKVFNAALGGVQIFKILD